MVNVHTMAGYRDMFIYHTIYPLLSCLSVVFNLQYHNPFKYGIWSITQHACLDEHPIFPMIYTELCITIYYYNILVNLHIQNIYIAMNRTNHSMHAFIFKTIFFYGYLAQIFLLILVRKRHIT